MEARKIKGTAFSRKEGHTTTTIPSSFAALLSNRSPAHEFESRRLYCKTKTPTINTHTIHASHSQAILGGVLASPVARTN